MSAQNPNMVADTPELRRKIQKLIKVYKENFRQIDAGERYKWRAIGQFQAKWDLDAPDFLKMLQESFSKAKNLLANNNYYPLGMLTERTAHEPEAVRAAFRALLDEQVPFQQRYDAFKSGFKTYAQSVNVHNTYQDLRAVMVYLTFAYPEKYYLYKHQMHSEFCKRFGIEASVSSVFAPEEVRLSAFNQLCDLLRSEIMRDRELLRMSASRLGDDCYPDAAYHLLTMDVIFYGSWAPEVLNALTGLHASSTDVPLNTILYGPPGTGKTYQLPVYAVSILENLPLAEVEGWERDALLARYEEYRAQGRVAFTTFHQSYGYEEFIEGIRPVLADAAAPADATDVDFRSDLSYVLEPGIFKRFCKQAAMSNAVSIDAEALGISSDPAVWKVSLQRTGDNPTRRECLENGHIRIGWEEYGPDITEETSFSSGGKGPLNAFVNRMSIGDIVLSCYSATEIDAIGVVTGEPEWHDEYRDFKRLRKVKWLDRSITDILQLNGGKRMTLSTVYQLDIAPAAVLKLLEERHPEWSPQDAQKKNFVFIIDEINRGNISKIFGELITLIEPCKRAGASEATYAVLPYSKMPFEVPGNVYLLGTMNTADRSIAAIDTALRRRFHFRELPPRPELLDGVFVEGLSIRRMLECMNRRIAALYDREHAIGHSYLLPLRESPDVAALAHIFRENILPLLQEYFFDDYEKIRLVLGDKHKSDDQPQFIRAVPCDPQALFGVADADCADFVYEIDPAAFDDIDAYRYLQ